MRKINYPLIVSDFDQTLTNTSEYVPPRVVDAIHEYTRCGGKFAVCTGRMVRSIYPRLQEIGLEGIFVAYQGAAVVDMESGRRLRYNGMSVEDSAYICETLEREGVTFNVYCDENLYTNLEADDPLIIRYETLTGVAAEHIDNLSAFVREKRMECQKITCLVDDNEREKLLLKVKALFEPKMDVTSSAGCLVEISDPRDNKAEGLKFIADYYGVPMERTVAVGDNRID